MNDLNKLIHILIIKKIILVKTLYYYKIIKTLKQNNSNFIY